MRPQPLGTPQQSLRLINFGNWKPIERLAVFLFFLPQVVLVRLTWHSNLFMCLVPHLFFLLDYSLQYSRAGWVIQEGTWLRQAFVEEPEWTKGRGCWHCCSLWVGVLCVVLCWWDCGKGIHNYRILPMRTTIRENVFQRLMVERLLSTLWWFKSPASCMLDFVLVLVFLFENFDVWWING